ncbi:hypothetical protein BFR57_02495 [Idiomarina sp. MD25a]|uniref:methionyl-tRNA formyltransferase n=1 Tax=Idiomarina sp. MD25a TaxID=1889913 RepID=UPI0008F84429|nr:formyltransferase family protein [Idiomarina sp. MD25a]OIM99454.1 hypothetical protein BFR57_02495 [Idiomarina sp. MD25a]
MNVDFVVFGTRHNTQDFVKRCQNAGIRVDLIVSIEGDVASKNNVPSYSTFSEVKGVPVYMASSYKLDSARDRAFLSQLEAKFGASIGWQRIIPDYVLERVEHGVFGMHCSPKPLPYGKGRSPLNWSIINGETNLFANIFKYRTEVDDGEILASPSLRIEPQDTINTLQLKAQLIFSQVMIDNYNNILNGNLELKANSVHFQETFFDKRTEADGCVDWSNSMQAISNFVRAQTTPYPGAFSFLKGDKVKLLEVWPFNIGTQCFDHYDSQPGEVLYSSKDGLTLVCCGDGIVMVTKHDYPDIIEIGNVFTFNRDI